MKDKKEKRTLWDYITDLLPAIFTIGSLLVLLKIYQTVKLWLEMTD